MDPLVRLMRDVMADVTAPKTIPSTERQRGRPNFAFQRAFHDFVVHHGWRPHRFGEVTEYQSPDGGAFVPLSNAFLRAHQHVSADFLI